MKQRISKKTTCHAQPVHQTGLKRAGSGFMMRRIRLMLELLAFIAMFVAVTNGFTPSSLKMARKLRNRITYEAHVSKRMRAKTQERIKFMDINANDPNTNNADTDAKGSRKCSKNAKNKGTIKGKCCRGCVDCPFNKPDRDLLAFPTFKDCE